MTDLAPAAIAKKLQAIAVQMGFTIKRTSRSLYVKDGEDFCATLVNVHGRVMATPDSVGSTLLTLVDCRELLATIGELGAGDVVIANEASSSGGVATHLADLHVIAPYYAGDVLVGYGLAFIHSSDIGGRVPSSISPFNTDVFQEGLQLPPVKLVRAGVLNDDVDQIIRINNRTPDANAADIRAMLAALHVGRAGVAELVERYGVDRYLAAQDALEQHSIARARELVSALPAGRRVFSDFLDDDGISPYPVRYQVALTVQEDGGLAVDFTGTDVQVPAAFNIVSRGRPQPMTTGRIRSALVTLDPTFDADGGHTQILSVTAPEGTVVNAVRPAAVGVRHGSAVRVSDTIGGAFVQLAPQIMPVAGSGVVIPVVVSEQDGHGRGSQVITRLFGGFGAAHGLDGHDGKDNSYSNLASSPMESSEAELDVHVLRYGLRPDSGGPGRWRGGMGRELSFRIDADGTQVLARGLERFVFRP
ncbi:MAG TPA: hydantoinase B/oxoprolinase family protein, partial [Cellulomonas sp.]